jgi:membrane fusion protein, multidrug efflux system
MDERVDRPASEPVPQSRGPLPTGLRLRRTHLYWVFWLVILLALVGVGIRVWTHHATSLASHSGARPGFATPPQPVGAATVGKGDIRIILNELGTVTSLDTVTVYTQINGQFTEVGFQEGEIVKEGDFLAQIDPRPYQAALDQAQGTLAHDQGLLEQARADLKRYQTLGRQDSIAQQQLEDQKYLVAQYTGTVAADQGTVETDKLNLAYCHIVSPITGQIGLRLIDPGNYVQTSNTTGIAVITQMQPISVLFSVPQQDVLEIIKRMRSGATLPVTAYDQGNTNVLATGKLATIDNQINTTTGTLQMRAMFDNPNETLYPNEFVNARLLVGILTDVVRVPVPAVLRGAPGTYAYVINANSTVSVRPIKVGPTDDGYEEVLSGLQAGERVVTDGTDRLADGAAVVIPPHARSLAAAAAGSTQPGAHGTSPGEVGSTSQSSRAAQSGQAARRQGQPRQGQQMPTPQNQ